MATNRRGGASAFDQPGLGSLFAGPGAPTDRHPPQARGVGGPGPVPPALRVREFRRIRHTADTAVRTGFYQSIRRWIIAEHGTGGCLTRTRKASKSSGLMLERLQTSSMVRRYSGDSSRRSPPRPEPRCSIDSHSARLMNSPGSAIPRVAPPRVVYSESSQGPRGGSRRWNRRSRTRASLGVWALAISRRQSCRRSTTGGSAGVIVSPMKKVNSPWRPIGPPWTRSTMDPSAETERKTDASIQFRALPPSERIGTPPWRAADSGSIG